MDGSNSTPRGVSLVQPGPMIEDEIEEIADTVRKIHI